MTGGNMKKKIRQIDPIKYLGKVRKFQAKRAKGFRNMQQSIQPRARCPPPPVWVGLKYFTILTDDRADI